VVAAPEAIQGAQAVGLGDEVSSLEAGKQVDLLTLAPALCLRYPTTKPNPTLADPLR